MNNIKSFNQYNEGLGSWLKGLITGEKTEDDKIAKNLLKNVDNIEFREGPGLYPRPITFDYEGYRFYLYYGESEFYGNEVSYNDMMKIESDFLKKLYDIAKIRIREKEQSDYKKRKEKERLELEKETIEFIEKNGGIEDIVFNILKTNFEENKKKYPDKLDSIYSEDSGIRYDNDRNFNRLVVILDTFNFTKTGNRITSVSYDFKSNKLEINVSYAAYSDHIEYKMTLNKDHEWYKFFLDLKETVIKYNKLKSKEEVDKKKSVLSRFK